MEPKLIAAYLALQLNPNNGPLTAAFEALCWKHMLQRTSSYWVQQVQIGALPLVKEIRTDSSTRKKIYAYDHTLDRLTFEFVQNYAGAIWPSTEEKRSHLTPKGDRQHTLKAISAYLRASTRTQAKLERDLGRPCTEQMIVAESFLGRKVREFLRELVTTREAPSVDHYSAKEAVQTVLESFEATASTVAPGHPEITSARFPCQYPGCKNIYVWSEALAKHVSLAHAILRPSLPDTTIDWQTLPASNASIVQDDARPPVQGPMSARGLSQWSDTQMGFASPISFSVTSSQQAAQVIDPNFNNTSMHSPIIISDDEDGEGNASGLWSMPTDRGTDTQTGFEVPVPSSIAGLHEAGPIDNSGPYNAEVVSVISLGDEEDSEDDVSGLLCPHAGCQLRFPDWASFENHAQLPHDKGPRASNGGEMTTANAATDHGGLHEATKASEVERNGDNFQSTQLQRGLLLEGSLSGGTIRWRNMAGERI